MVKMNILKNRSLKEHNTFGIDAKAKYYIEIKDLETLKALARNELRQIPYLILGGGSNLLFGGDFDGLVVKIDLKGKRVYEKDSHFILEASAGENWHETVLYSLDKGLNGMENLSLIPGTVGAAPIQNIGAYGVELKDIFEALEAFNIQTGEIERFSKEECQFDYRYSTFKGPDRGRYIILKVYFRLHRNPVFNINYGSLNALLQNQKEPLNARKVSEAVIKIRQSKLPNPEEIGNAGSFFKNPVITLEYYEQLKSEYPEVPGYKVNEEHIKVPAGWLIEKNGWKGKRFGHVGVHAKQALVLVNYGGASGEELIHLSKEIQAGVMEEFRIHLEPEVTIIK